VVGEVKILENYGREMQLRKRWMEIWDSFGKRILKFPKWMQVIILQDINTAIENRIAVMEMLQNAKRSY
jgi:hypothetical protein